MKMNIKIFFLTENENEYSFKVTTRQYSIPNVKKTSQQYSDMNVTFESDIISNDYYAKNRAEPSLIIVMIVGNISRLLKPLLASPLCSTLGLNERATINDAKRHEIKQFNNLCYCFIFSISVIFFTRQLLNLELWIKDIKNLVTTLKDRCNTPC